jgi:ribonucleoside-triphosphate reductase
LSKFINVARDYFKSEFPTLNDAQIEDLVRKDIRDGVQTLQYQILTLQTTNGQTPFVSVCLYLNEAENEQEKENLALVIEEILKQRMKGVKNENGQYYANPFPKLLYVLEEDNITPDSKYWYLTKLAAECTTKRMVPDYISEKVMKQLKISKKGEPGDCYPCMGCRSFLTPYRDPKTKKPKYYGRFNQGVVTINLPDVALSAKGDLEKFWYILEQRLELCHRALRLRHEHLRGVKSDVAPILWQNGAFARLGKGETIDKLLYNGYSTISLGYAGLYETVKILIGKSLTDEDGMVLGKKIMQALNDKCRDWKQVEKIDYSVYGTPIENTTEKFAKALQRRFGTIPGITDRNYITNSYHVPVFEKIDAFKKIDIEAELQKLSPGGAISYIETPNMENNVDAILSVIKYIYDNIMYCEINTELDWCHCCGSTGTIEMIRNEDGKFIWKCKQCGNTDLAKMNVVRRVCGYLGNANYMAQGRMGDIHDRVKHL